MRIEARLLALAAAATIVSYSNDLSSKCVAGTFAGLGADGTTITSATLYAAGAQMPSGGGPGGGGPPGGGGGSPGGSASFPFAVCEVKGIIPSANNFALSFPADSDNWNGKYIGLGGAGTAGSVNESGTLTNAVSGYAASSSDQGHSSSNDGTWEEDTQLLIDFAYRANHLTAEASKAFLNAYYGTTPTYSYFNGCSGGGGAAMAEATRYPGDYNGVLAGAAASNPTRMWPYEMSLSALTYNDTTSTWPTDYVNKLTLISKAAIAACDALDGITDGLIDDPRACHFDPGTLVCSPVTSTSHSDTSCLTPEQAEVVRKIYAGLTDPYSGVQLFPGFVRGSEASWSGHITAQSGADAQYMAYAVMKDPNAFDWRNFLLTNSVYYDAFYAGDQALGPILDSMNPDLTAVQAAGTKVILYHGWADTNISPGNSINYFESVVAQVAQSGGDPASVKDNLRLFLVPGMGHCGGSAGYNSFDAFAPLVNWVENGVAPDQIVGTNAAKNTRPLCPYPEVARPNSTSASATGGPATSSEYACVPPAVVRFEPAVIDLGSSSGGVLKAYLSVPTGYNIADWSVQSVTLNGASPADVAVVDGALVASFRIADMTGLAAGDAVPVTVNFTMTRNGAVVFSQVVGTVGVQ